MLRTLFRIFFTISLTLGAFAGLGTNLAYAASQPPTAAGYNPVASVPSGVDYCYPSGYNKQGWRCGWRLAMAPYNLGGYGYCGGYYGGYSGCGYYGGYNNCYYGGYNNCNYGGYNNCYYGGYNNCNYGGYYGGYRNSNISDYGGQPRYGYYGGYCGGYYGGYCGGYNNCYYNNRCY